MSSEPSHRIRKNLRLREFDYSTPGSYFITICAFDRRMIFGGVVDGQVHPSTLGELATGCWHEIPSQWPGIDLDAFVVMPNHIHGVLHFIEGDVKLPPLGRVVHWYKASVTKAIRRVQKGSVVTIWQEKFYDHVVRDEHDFERIRKYIELNPGRWSEDEYYGA